MIELSDRDTDYNDRYANWVSVTVSGVSGWRAIKQTEANLSYGIELFKADSVPITVANGTQIIYVEYMANEKPGITTGLITSSIAPDNSDISNYINYGTHSYTFWENNISYSYYYAVTKIGGGTPYNKTRYAGIDAYAVYGSVDSSTYNPNLHMAILANNNDAGYGYDRYIQSIYSIASSNSGNGWADYSTHGYTFAAITAPYNATSGNGAWSGYTINCDNNCDYKIEIDANCAGTGYEGVLVYTNTITKPDEGTKTSDLTGTVHKIDGSGTLSFDVNASDSVRNYYVYFRSSPYQGDGTIARYGFNSFRFASIKTTKLIDLTINANGGKIDGQNFVKFSKIEPYTPYPVDSNGDHIAFISSTVLSNVSRSKYADGYPDWEKVDGVYDSSSGGNLVLTSYGKHINSNWNKIIETDSSKVDWYLHWKDSVSYSFVSEEKSIWCTLDSSEASVTTAPMESMIPITDDNHFGVKFAHGSTVVVTYNHSNHFTISSDAKYLIVPEGLQAGTYTQEKITLTSPSDPTYESVSVTTESKLPSVHISAVTATYNDPIQPTITQKTSIPARGVTLTTDNMNTYFSHSPVWQIIDYTNHTSSRNDSISYSWVGADISIPSLGINYKPDGVDISINNSNSMRLKATGEGGKETYSEPVTVAHQAPNTVVSVFVFASPSILNVDESMIFVAGAEYTSGDTRDLIQSTDPSMPLIISYPTYLSEISTIRDN